MLLSLAKRSCRCKSSLALGRNVVTSLRGDPEAESEAKAVLRLVNEPFEEGWSKSTAVGERARASSSSDLRRRRRARRRLRCLRRALCPGGGGRPSPAVPRAAGRQPQDTHPRAGAGRTAAGFPGLSAGAWRGANAWGTASHDVWMLVD